MIDQIRAINPPDHKEDEYDHAKYPRDGGAPWIVQNNTGQSLSPGQLDDINLAFQDGWAIHIIRPSGQVLMIRESTEDTDTVDGLRSELAALQMANRLAAQRDQAWVDATKCTGAAEYRTKVHPVLEQISRMPGLAPFNEAQKDKTPSDAAESDVSWRDVAPYTG